MLTDARLKVVLTFLLIIGIVLPPADAFPAYALLWGLVGSLAAAHRISVWRLARLAGVALIFSLAALPLLLTTSGDPLLTVAGISISKAGAVRFFSIILKSWLSAQAALLLSLTTPFTELLGAFAALKLPAPLVAILSFMYRYLFVLREESERLLRARASRSAGKKSYGGLRWQAQTAGSMVGNLFLRSYERSERVQAAMAARGYRGQTPVFEKKPLPTREIFVMLGILAVLVMIEWGALLLWS